MIEQHLRQLLKRSEPLSSKLIRSCHQHGQRARYWLDKGGRHGLKAYRGVPTDEDRSSPDTNPVSNDVHLRLSTALFRVYARF
jgi:hypothetical protein